jgi:hypothetical protein
VSVSPGARFWRQTPKVEFLPFLGFLIHTDLVSRIGLPEKGFFIP